MNLRHGRFCFFRSPATPGGNNTTVVSGSDLGTVQTGGFSRITAMFSVVGSMTLQFRSGVHSGNYLVNSSVTINSGSTILDMLNFGLYLNVNVTAANSQTPTFLLLGEPVR